MKWGKRVAFLILFLSLVVLIVVRVSAGQKPNEPAGPTETPEPEPTIIVYETPPVELTEIMNADQLAALDTSALQRIDLTGSTCYDAIEAFREAHPSVELIYAVLIEGEGEPLPLDPDTDAITLEDASLVPSLIENAAHLPRLASIQVKDDLLDGAAADSLREAYPDAEFNYQVHLLDERYPYDTEELTLTGLSAETAAELVPQLSALNHLQSVSIPQAENELTLEDALALSDANPLIQLDYQIDLFGTPVSLNTESIEFENTDIGPEGLEVLRGYLPYFRNLQYLKLDDCGIDNETMEKLRDDYPDVKVVWRVYFGNYHTLTDTEMIWATGGSVNDGSSKVLKYCTDVKYLDLGHNLMTQVEFLRCMPKLEVAIFAISWVTDITPIEDCPNLEYLELFSTRVTDFSPLAKCTHLQHLNISHSVDTNNVSIPCTDISPLYDLPELKRFYCTMSNVPQEQQDEMISRHPDCEIEFGWVDPAEGFWRFKDGNKFNTSLDNRNERYALLCEQFGYDTLQQSGKMWSLYG